MSSSNCCFLTCIPISQEAGQVVWYSHLLKNSPQFVVIKTVKGFGIVNKAEVDVFMELSYFFNDPVNVGIWSLAWRILSITLLACAPAAAQSLQWCPSLFYPIDGSPPGSVHGILLTRIVEWVAISFPLWDECNFAVVWAFFGTAFLWDWNENWPIPVLWPLLSFPNLLAYWVQHFHSIIF